MLLRVPPGLNLKKIQRSAGMVYLCALCGSHTKHRFSFYASFSADLNRRGPRLRCLWRAPRESLCREKKKEPTFWYINVRLDEKLKWSIIYRFYLLSIKQSNVVFIQFKTQKLANQA